MQMTPSKLILFRSLNLTVGRVPFISQMLRKVLVHILIKSNARKEPYTASSRFFVINELSSNQPNDK